MFKLFNIATAMFELSKAANHLSPSRVCVLSKMTEGAAKFSFGFKKSAAKSKLLKPAISEDKPKDAPKLDYLTSFEDLAPQRYV